MVIGITGVSGFVGRTVAQIARSRGHRVVGFSREPARLLGICDEARSFSNLDLTGCEAIVHLSGESIAGYWTPGKKARIRESRIRGTRAVVEAFARCSSRPLTLVAASAIGFYGDCGDAVVTESNPAGSGFLAEVCKAWEQESARAEEGGSRVGILRLGVVLGKNGGALAQMLPAFRVGLGAKMGSGKQWFSWITLHDAARMFLFAVENPSVSGIVNATTPHPVQNAEFTRVLAQSVGRPAFLTVPAGMLRLLLGEMAEELLGSKRVIPVRAQALGFAFDQPGLDEALKDCVS